MSKETNRLKTLVDIENDTRGVEQDALTRGRKEKDMATSQSIKPWTFMRLPARDIAVALLCGLFIAGAPPSALAQFFNSGSSGVHGPFPPVPTGGMPTGYAAIVWNMRTGHVWYCSSYTAGTGLDACDGTPIAEAQIPNIPPGGLTTGVYEFTNVVMDTVNGQYRSVVVVGGSPNTPLSILSQTNITIAGSNGYTMSFMVRGWDGRTPLGSSPNLGVFGGKGGPGGFDGGQSGNGGSTPGNGSPGLGPAGGQGGNAGATTAAGIYGSGAQASGLNPSLTPLTGGSGGGGGAGIDNTPPSGCSVPGPTGYAGGGGGGGGGALLLAASNKVTLGAYSIVWANGGNGGSSSAGCGAGAGGAGGSVRVVATEFTGPGDIYVYGGSQPGTGTNASGGFVRFESSASTYTGTISGSAGGSFISFPTAPIPAIVPQLRITSINAASVPSTSGASLTAPDIVFPGAIDTPVTLTVSASNVPLGTAVNVRVAPAIGAPSTTTTNGLSGTLADSQAQATVTLPPGAGVVTATATFNVASGQSAGILPKNLPLIDGERPQQVEVMTMADGTSKTYLIAKSGARFEVGAARP